jgi:GNAT superfamily N-acetyltransferase
MPILLRPFDAATDYSRLFELMNMAYADVSGEDDLREEDRNRHPDDVWQRMMAVDAVGQLVGTSSVWHPSWSQAGQYWVQIIVDPIYLGQGIGLALYEAALDFANAHGAVLLDATIRDDDPRALCFAEGRGFHIERHIFESDLDVTSFDETPFINALASLLAAGITFTSYQQVMQQPEAAKTLYELHRDTMNDIPGWEYGFPAFEEYQRQVLGGAWWLPEGTYIARHQGTWIGFVMLQKSPDPTCLIHTMTGVRREYRGRRIALALKLLTIRFARARRITTLRTGNDSLNAPMLMINRKLGYQPNAGTYHLHKVM